MPRDWNTFLKGAFAERLEEEFEKVAENIQDPNYDAKAKRQTVIVIDFLGDEYREIADISVVMHSKLPKKLPVKSRMLFNRDSKGKAVCAESEVFAINTITKKDRIRVTSCPEYLSMYDAANAALLRDARRRNDKRMSKEYADEQIM